MFLVQTHFSFVFFIKFPREIHSNSTHNITKFPQGVLEYSSIRKLIAGVIFGIKNCIFFNICAYTLKAIYL